MVHLAGFVVKNTRIIITDFVFITLLVTPVTIYCSVYIYEYHIFILPSECGIRVVSFS